MANHKSALKRARQNQVRRLRNRTAKTRIKNIVKEVRLAVDETSQATAVDKLNAAKSVIAKTAKRGIIHKRTAARKISRLSRHINTISA